MRVRLADIDVGCTRVGEGPVAVMVHGLAEDRNSWADVQRRLSDFTTYAYDLRGHGETGLGEAGARWNNWAATSLPSSRC